MAAHGILVSAQEMIIRWRKDRFIAEIVPNVPPETRRRPPVAAATGTRYLPNIAGTASTAASISFIKKKQQQHHAAAASCSSTMQQQFPNPFITPILDSIL